MVLAFLCVPSLPAFSQLPQGWRCLCYPHCTEVDAGVQKVSCSRSSAAKKQNQYFKLSLFGFKASCFFYYNVPLLYETIPDLSPALCFQFKAGYDCF